MRYHPKINDHLPPIRGGQPMCKCNHQRDQHPEDDACGRWLTKADSSLEPPEAVQCKCSKFADRT